MRRDELSVVSAEKEAVRSNYNQCIFHILIGGIQTIGERHFKYTKTHTKTLFIQKKVGHIFLFSDNQLNFLLCIE